MGGSGSSCKSSSDSDCSDAAKVRYLKRKYRDGPARHEESLARSETNNVESTKGGFHMSLLENHGAGIATGGLMVFGVALLLAGAPLLKAYLAARAARRRQCYDATRKALRETRRRKEATLAFYDSDSGTDLDWERGRRQRRHGGAAPAPSDVEWAVEQAHGRRRPRAPRYGRYHPERRGYYDPRLDRLRWDTDRFHELDSWGGDAQATPGTAGHQPGQRCAPLATVQGDLPQGQQPPAGAQARPYPVAQVHLGQ